MDKTALYKCPRWQSYSMKIKKKDGYKCYRCGISESEAKLHVYQTTYHENLLPFEYPMDGCYALCEPCYQSIKQKEEPERKGRQPKRGWTLVEVVDLGDLSGLCKRETANKGLCHQAIRYEQHAYHPKWGREVFGSTCIEHLTETDQEIVKEVRKKKIPEKINDAFETTYWEDKVHKNEKATKYKLGKVGEKGLIMMYNNYYGYSFKMAFKLGRGRKAGYDFQKNYINTKTKCFDKATKLAITALLGTMQSSEAKKKIYRSEYTKTLHSAE